jgi:hypothetical protein
LSKADPSKADLKIRLYDDNTRAESAVVEAGLQARLPV